MYKLISYQLYFVEEKERKCESEYQGHRRDYLSVVPCVAHSVRTNHISDNHAAGIREAHPEHHHYARYNSKCTLYSLSFDTDVAGKYYE